MPKPPPRSCTNALRKERMSCFGGFTVRRSMAAGKTLPVRFCVQRTARPEGSSYADILPRTAEIRPVMGFRPVPHSVPGCIQMKRTEVHPAPDGVRLRIARKHRRSCHKKQAEAPTIGASALFLPVSGRRQGILPIYPARSALLSRLRMPRRKVQSIDVRAARIRRLPTFFPKQAAPEHGPGPGMP